MDQIALICISYKTFEQAQRFIREVTSHASSAKVDIYLVDNSPDCSPETEVAAFRKSSSSIEYVPLLANPGYFGAAEWIRKTESFQSKAYDWVIIANVDMDFCDENFFNKLNKYSSRQKLGVIAPAIISELSNRDTNPMISVRPKPSKMYFYKLIFSTYLSSQAYNLLGIAKAKLKKVFGSAPERAREENFIYAPQGSFMIFSKNYFDAGGTFAHGVFLYGEEVTVAEFCRKKGLHILHAPELKVIHHERGSTGMFYSRRVIHWKKQSNDYLYDTYFRG